jgi:hTAFII28-like protein conserved region
MLQIMSTFSKLEQSRFEAFRRSAIPADTVESYMAAVLCHRWNVPPKMINGDSTRCFDGLADLVQPGTGNAMVTVVATLAKIYAQRLVAAASQVAKQENGYDATAAAAPLQPQHVLQAYRIRQERGLDPGFFFCNSSSSGPLPDHQSFANRLLAARAVQQEYDLQYPPDEQGVDEALDEPPQVSEDDKACCVGEWGDDTYKVLSSEGSANESSSAGVPGHEESQSQRAEESRSDEMIIDS